MREWTPARLTRLKRAYSIFVRLFLALVGAKLLLGVIVIYWTENTIPSPETLEELEYALGWLTLMSKGLFFYIVYSLSRALQHSVGRSLLFSILAVLPVLYLIPLIGLWAEASRRLRIARDAS